MKLDRLNIEEGWEDPWGPVFSIHYNLGFPKQAFDIEELAKELDIVEIRYESLRNLEGALITDRAKDKGSILVNRCSSLERRRFTIAHELGHFLNFWHIPISPDGFWCNKSDLNAREASGSSRFYNKQEVEANRFASELLMPQWQLMSQIEDYGALEHVYELARIYKVSKEAMARRYVKIHNAKMSIIFSKDGKMRYPVNGKGMPRLKVREGEFLPHLDLAHFAGKEKAGAEIDPNLWLNNSENGLICEHFNQSNGYAMTLLQICN